MPARQAVSRARRVAAVGLLAVLIAAACAGDPVVPGDPRRPRLLTPGSGVRFAQNDPRSGCTPHPTGGSGHRIAFAWSNVAGAREYVIDFRRRGAFPVLHAILTATSTEFVSCGFVADANLEGWEWRVGALFARSAGAADTVWSESQEHAFLPCRLADGQFCYAE